MKCNIILNRWVAENCSKASLLMKIDDDVLLKESEVHSLYKRIHLFARDSVPIYAGNLVLMKIPALSLYEATLLCICTTRCVILPVFTHFIVPISKPNQTITALMIPWISV